jgi:hypothetical protein
MAPVWIVVVVMAFAADNVQTAVWTDDQEHPALYKSEAACERAVKVIKAKIAKVEDMPPYAIGCKKVEMETRGDLQDPEHT